MVRLVKTFLKIFYSLKLTYKIELKPKKIEKIKIRNMKNPIKSLYFDAAECSYIKKHRKKIKFKFCNKGLL